MIRESLTERLCIYRPTTKQDTSAKRTYKRGYAYKVKFAQPSTGATVDSTGVVRQRSATIYFNPPTSYFTAIDDGFSLEFKSGDVITFGDIQKTPKEDDKFVVKSVTVHRFKGVIHHYEVICV